MTNKRFHIVEKMLRSEADTEELHQLSECITDDAFREEMDTYYRRKWDEAQGEVPEELRLAMWNNLQRQTEAPRPVRPFRYRLGNWYKTAAAVILPVAIWAGAYKMWHGEPTSEVPQYYAESVVTVDNGQKAGIQLPDGTKVWLNSGTVLRYNGNYNRTDRVVRLQGEAYFEVAKDKTRPFIVQTQAYNVRALGTAFDVKAYPNEHRTTTTLVEGKVKVYNPSFCTQMEPNQKVVLDKKTHRLSRIRIDDAELACMWKQNQLAFDSETLGEIAVILERSYNIEIEFETEKIKHIRFSGVIRNNSLESVLQLIALAAPVKYSLNQSKVTFSPATKTSR